MVSVLNRKISDKGDTIHLDIGIDHLSKANIEDNFCALREFINLSANLPTIEELAQRSQAIARALGMFKKIIEE